MRRRLFLMLAMLLPLFGLQAQTFTVDNADGVTIKYSVLSSDDHTVEVTTHSYSGRVVVPDTVVYEDTVWTVTSIGTAFKGKLVTYLGVPATVKSLVADALANCHRLDTLFLASETAVAVPMVGGYRKPERIFLTSNQDTTLYVGVTVVVPCGSLQAYRGYHWRNFPTLTSTCAVPIVVQATVDSLFRFDSIVYRENGQTIVHFSNRYYEVGDTARVMAERMSIRIDNWNSYTPRFGWLIGWSNGANGMDFRFAVEHADTIVCITDTFHYATLSASRITTPVYQYGNLSYDGQTSNYRFRDLGNVSTLFSSALWVASGDSLSYNRDEWQLKYDSAVTARVAVARFAMNGPDYYPGPLRLIDGGTDIQTVLDFNRVWKVSREMIDYHIAHCADAGYEPVDDILTWPGNGPEGYAAQLAPYYDADSDGVYNPRRGDYPLILGDECVFSIFNDTYGPHGESGAQPLGIEVHAMTYAFNEPADTALWNTVFVHYDIYNRSSSNHPNTYLGAWSDFDLGYAWDDYIGCDVRRGMYYAYNGDAVDGPGSGSFEGIPPAQGCVILSGAPLPADGIDNPKIDIPYIQSYGASPLQALLEEYGDGNGGYDTAALSHDAEMFFNLDYRSWKFFPGDTLGNTAINGMNFGDGIVDNERMGMTSFIYYDNSYSSINGEPSVPTDFFNYMHSYWKNWQHVKYAGNGISTGTSTLDASFMFPDDSDPWHWGTDGMVPEINPDDWNEVSAGNYPGDRRGLSSSGPFTFTAGSHQQFDLAYTTGFGTENNWSSVTALGSNVDNVRRQFVRDSTDSHRPFCYRPFSAPVDTTTSSDTTGIDDVSLLTSRISLYPNPTAGNVTVSIEGADVRELQLLDLYGRVVLRLSLSAQRAVTLDLSALPQGVYILRAGATARRIIKK